MKNRISFILSSFLLLTSCNNHGTDYGHILNKIHKELESGNLKRTIFLADSVKRVFPDNSAIREKADSLALIAERIALDFSVNEEQIIKQIVDRQGSFSKEEKKC